VFILSIISSLENGFIIYPHIPSCSICCSLSVDAGLLEEFLFRITNEKIVPALERAIDSENKVPEYVVSGKYDYSSEKIYGSAFHRY